MIDPTQARPDEGKRARATASSAPAEGAPNTPNAGRATSAGAKVAGAKAGSVKAGAAKPAGSKAGATKARTSGEGAAHRRAAAPIAGHHVEPSPQGVLLADAMPPDPVDRERAIRERAYELYVERGRIGGRELEDWIEAETQIDQWLMTGQPAGQEEGG